MKKIIKAIKYVKYLPEIVFQIKNWPDFILHYIGLKEGGTEYTFRNGIQIKTKDAISTTTIAVIFIKKDYGDVSDNSVVIDIGANIGVFSIFAATAKNAIAYAYEPAHDNFDLLRENVKLNKLENRIFPFNFGIAAKKEKRRLYLGESPFHSFLSVQESPFNALHDKLNQNPSQKYFEINCISLKDVFEENKIKRCDILKIDCEGAEYEILYNLPDEYFKRIKKIRLEYHNHKTNKENNGSNLAEFLAKKGFKIEKFKKSSKYQGDLWLKQESQPIIK